MDSLFFGLTTVCLFVLRARARAAHQPGVAFTVPGHPCTTLLFIAAEWLVVVSTFAHDAKRSLIGLGIALAGLPAYWLWRTKARRAHNR